MKVDYTDPLYRFLLEERLEPYMPYVRAFWKEVAEEKLNFPGMGTFAIEAEGCPPMLKFRTSTSGAKSPIKGVQVFPFIPSACLNISGIPGGAVKMIKEIVGTGYKFHEFTIIEKAGLSSVYYRAQFLAFVPTEIMEKVEEGRGKWVYLTHNELIHLAKGSCDLSVMNKAQNYAQYYI